MKREVIIILPSISGGAVFGIGCKIVSLSLNGLLPLFDVADGIALIVGALILWIFGFKNIKSS